MLILSDYAKGALSHSESLIALAKKAGVPVLVDPKGSDFERYRGATLLTPNLHEFEAVVGACASENELVEKGQVLQEKLDLEALLITRGEHGMTLLRAGQPELHFPARAREVYDVTAGGIVLPTYPLRVLLTPRCVALCQSRMGQQFAPADHLQSRPSVQGDVTGIAFAIFQELAPHQIGHLERISWTVQRNILAH